MISSYTLAKFRVIITLWLILQPIVGRPIPIDSEVLKRTENKDEDTKNTNVGKDEDTKKTNDGKDEDTNVGRHHCNDPSANDGYFRDPLEILEASRLCGSVCKSYQESMYIDQGVTVSLINSNCDYIGDTILEQHSANETHAATCPDLSTACVCAYNVRCNRKTKLMKYTLTPNEKGYLKVLASDCGLSEYVT